MMQVMVNQLSQQGDKRIYFPLDKVVRGYDPLDMVSLIPIESRSKMKIKVLQTKMQPDSISNISNLNPKRSLKTFHMPLHAIHIIT